MKDAEPKRLISRRNVLKLAGYSVAGSGLCGLWKLSYDAQTGEKLRKMNEWEPQVASFLSETIMSEKLDNLTVFSEIARPQFVDMVSRNVEPLLSSTDSTASRYNLLVFALGEHYGLRIPQYGEGQTIPLDEETLSFLDRTVARVGLERIREKRVDYQANMWVEALYRSYAAAWELDPTMPEGVYLPENQSLFGRSLASSNRFVRLQPHS